MSAEQALIEELARVTEERDQARELLKRFMHGADQLLRDLDCLGIGELSEAMNEWRKIQKEVEND